MKKPSSKGTEYKLSQIKNKRQRIYSRLLRKYGAIEDLFYSNKNKVAVDEELVQLNDILKLIVAAHDEWKQYMEWEKVNNSDHKCSKDSSKSKNHSSRSSKKVQNRAVQIAPSQTG